MSQKAWTVRGSVVRGSGQPRSVVLITRIHEFQASRLNACSLQASRRGVIPYHQVPKSCLKPNTIHGNTGIWTRWCGAAMRPVGRDVHSSHPQTALGLEHQHPHPPRQGVPSYLNICRMPVGTARRLQNRDYGTGCFSCRLSCLPSTLHSLALPPPPSWRLRDCLGVVGWTSVLCCGWWCCSCACCCYRHRCCCCCCCCSVCCQCWKEGAHGWQKMQRKGGGAAQLLSAVSGKPILLRL
jgi:hypothetical protein